MASNGHGGRPELSAMLVHRNRCQSGQIMPLGIALILFVILTGVVLFNMGKLTSVKARLANTADAAVYSGLLWQARALNFQSYSNRAMVANQVTMAQAVSLRAWSLYGEIAAENVNTVLGSIPYVGTLSGAVQTAMASTSAVLEPLGNAVFALANMLNGVLSQAQSAMYAAAFAATPDILREITRSNDSTFSVDTVFSVSEAGANLQQWHRFTQRYDTDNDHAMQLRADMINQSRDQFSVKRSWEFFNSWFYLAPFVKMKVHKRGETRLIAVENDSVQSAKKNWEWKAKDTLSLNTRIWHPFGSDKKIELPIGWGQALANNSVQQDSVESGCERGECDRWFDYNRASEYMSDNNIASLAGTASREKLSSYYAGIRAYRDLAHLGAQDKDPRIHLRIEVETPIESIDTASRFGIGGIFSTTDHVASGAMASIASAEVYFRKPLQAGEHHHIEYANLYNPFWDTRLTDTPDQTRLQALLLRGVPVSQPQGSNIVAGQANSNPPLSQYQSSPSMLDITQHAQLQLHDPAVAASTLLDIEVTHAIENAVAGVSAANDNAVSALDMVENPHSLATGFADAQVQAEAETSQVAAAFGQIRQGVALAYDQAAAELETQSQQQRDKLASGIIALQAELAADLAGVMASAIEAAISALQGQLDELIASDNQLKAEALVSIVNNASSYTLDADTALLIVSLEGDIGDNLEEVLRVSCGDEALDMDDNLYQKDEDCDHW